MFAAVSLSLVVLAATPRFQPFDGAQDHFHAAFPGSPKVESSKQDGVVTRTYAVDADHAVYAIIVVNDRDTTAASASDEFKSFRDAAGEDSKITGERKLTLGALQGLELKLKGAKMDSIARLYVGAGRTWTVVVDVDAGHTFTEIAADAFFDGFAVTDAPPVAATTTPAKDLPNLDDSPMSPDGVDLFGWTPDGSKVGVIQHGVYDGRGIAWATVTFFDTKKNAPLAPPVVLDISDPDFTEQDAVVQARTKAAVEAKRLKLPALVPGLAIKTDEKGALSAKDGSPVGNLELKAKKAGKKAMEQARDCNEPFLPELLTVKLYLMGGDGPIPVLAERKVPAARGCSTECAPLKTFGQGTGGLFVLRCRVQAFEGFEWQPVLVTVGGLEYPLETPECRGSPRTDLGFSRTRRRLLRTLGRGGLLADRRLGGPLLRSGFLHRRLRRRGLLHRARLLDGRLVQGLRRLLVGFCVVVLGGLIHRVGIQLVTVVLVELVEVVARLGDLTVDRRHQSDFVVGINGLGRPGERVDGRGDGGGRGHGRQHAREL